MPSLQTTKLVPAWLDLNWRRVVFELSESARSSRENFHTQCNVHDSGSSSDEEESDTNRTTPARA